MGSNPVKYKAKISHKRKIDYHHIRGKRANELATAFKAYIINQFPYSLLSFFISHSLSIWLLSPVFNNASI